MIYLLAFGLLLLLVLLPQFWVRYVLERYNRDPEDNFPGNGAELARHLLDRYGLQEVAVETTDKGDHYDPSARAVRLSPDKYNGKTLTAITVAAHECGHAYQHALSEPLFLLRGRLAGSAVIAQRIGVRGFLVDPGGEHATTWPGIVDALQEEGHAGRVKPPHPISQTVSIAAGSGVKADLREAQILPLGL